MWPSGFLDVKKYRIECRALQVDALPCLYIAAKKDVRGANLNLLAAKTWKGGSHDEETVANQEARSAKANHVLACPDLGWKLPRQSASFQPTL
jgi:hypothetical protein